MNINSLATRIAYIPFLTWLSFFFFLSYFFCGGVGGWRRGHGGGEAEGKEHLKSRVTIVFKTMHFKQVFEGRNNEVMIIFLLEISFFIL